MNISYVQVVVTDAAECILEVDVLRMYNISTVWMGCSQGETALLVGEWCWDKCTHWEPHEPLWYSYVVNVESVRDRRGERNYCID